MKNIQKADAPLSDVMGITDSYNPRYAGHAET